VRALLPDVAACAALALAVVAVFRSTFTRSALYLGDFDRPNSFLNILLHQVEALKRGHLVGWNDEMFLGINVLALPYTFPNPLNLLAAAFPTDQLYWVSGLISTSLLILAGWAAYAFVRNVAGHWLPSFVAALLYQFSAFSVLKDSQNDMSFAVAILLPLALLVLREVERRGLARSFLLLGPIVIALFLFTFLQKVAYSVLLLSLYSVYRSWTLRSWHPLAIWALAFGVALVAAAPRLITVADEFRFLDRGGNSKAPLTFEQIYEFQNIRPHDVLRWFDDGIFGRFPSEVATLGNNTNIHEGMLLWGSAFAAFLLLVGAGFQLTRLVRCPKTGLARWYHSPTEAIFFAAFLLLVFAVLLVKPVEYLFFAAFGGVDFTHARIVVAGLIVQAALVGLCLRTLLQPHGTERTRLTAPILGMGAVLGMVLFGAVTALSNRVEMAPVPAQGSLAFLADLNWNLLRTGQVGLRLQPPTGLTAEPFGRSQLDLSWRDGDGETWYAIHAHGPGTDQFQEIGRTPRDTTTFRMNGLQPATEYVVQIRSCTSVGREGWTCSEASPPVAATTGAADGAPPGEPPDAPMAPLIIVKSPGTVELRWAEVDANARYHIELQDSPGAPFRDIGVLPPTSTVYGIGDLAPNGQYAVRARACSAQACSGYSDAVPITPSAPTSPPVPQSPLPAAPTLSASSPTELRVTWQPVVEVSGYAVEVEGETDVRFVEVARVGRDVRTVTLPLTPDRGIAVRIRPCLADRCLAASPFASLLAPSSTLAPARSTPTPPWFLAAPRLLKIEWSGVAFVAILIGLVLARRAPARRAILVVALGSAMICDAVSFADEQVNGDQNRDPIAYRSGNYVLADPTAYRIPKDPARQALHDRLDQDRFRTITVCEPEQATRFCAPQVAALWHLRLVDGYSSGIPRRLTALPWPNDVLSVRTISFTSFDTLPWPLLSLLGVRQALGVTPALYANVPADGSVRDVRPDELKIVDNPLTPVPRVLFAASVQPALGVDEAVGMLFARGAGATPDIAARSVVEGYDGPLDLVTDGSVTAHYGDDAIDLDVTTSGGNRFLVINELYHPLWRAYVDGRPATVYPTNVVMRGIVVPPGATTVQLRFEPFARPRMLAIFLAVGVMLLLGGSWLLRRYEQAGRVMGGARASNRRADGMTVQPPPSRRGRDRRGWEHLAGWARRRTFFLASLLIAVWLSLEYLALGPFSWMYGYGGSLETIPVHLALALTGSTWTLWAPSVAGGLDRLSFWGNADPFNIEPLLFTTLPTWLAAGVHVFLQRLIAIYFTARVCSDQLGLSRRWSLLAALLHGGLGYFTVGEVFAFPSVPLLVWGLARLEERRRWWAWAFVGGALYSTFVTFSQSDPYLFVFAVGWTALVRGIRHWRAYALIVVFFAGLGVVELPQALAVLTNARFSHRAGLALEPVSLSLGGLFYYQMQFDFMDQDKLLRAIAVGFPPLALLAGGLAILVRPRPWTPAATLFLRVAALYLLLSLKVGWIGLQTLAVTVLPWLGGLFMGRFYTLPAAFMIAVLATLAARLVFSVVREPVIRGGLVAGLAGILCVLLIWPKLSLYYPLMVDGWGEEHYQVPALDALRRSDQSLYRVASVLDLQPGYAYGQGFETADGSSNLYPAVYRQLWLRVIGPLMQALPANRAVVDPTDGRPQDNYIFLGLSLVIPGLGPLPGEDPHEALRVGFDVDRRFDMALLSMLNVKYLLSRYPLQGQTLRLVHAPAEAPRVLDNRDYATGLVNVPPTHLANVSLVDVPSRMLRDGLQAIARKQAGKDLYIYENTAVLPRYRFVSWVEALESADGVLDRLAAMSADELRDSAVLERADAPAQVTERTLALGDVSVTCYTPDAIDLRTRTDGESFLVLSMTWNSAWRVAIDDASAALVRTNHAQLGVPVPAGEHTIRLRYQPWYGGPFALLARVHPACT
jgi:hypothetical protein